MGTRLLLLPLPIPITTTPPKPWFQPPNLISNTEKRGQRFKASGLRNGRPTSTGLGFEFDPVDGDPYCDRYGDSRWFEGASSSSKKRKWWYDDVDLDDDDDDDDDDDSNDWDFTEEAFGFPFFKIIKAFSWMLPAIAISLLLGTGPNAFYMALAVSLGQTALSLVIDKVWGNVGHGTRPRHKSKTGRKPFARDARGTKQSRRKQETNDGEEIGSYQSSAATGDGSNKKREKKAHTYGGWDELDGVNQRAKPNQEQPQETNGKLSRRGRVRDKPLMLRLLIAVFPFIASWTKFIF